MQRHIPVEACQHSRQHASGAHAFNHGLPAWLSALTLRANCGMSRYERPTSSVLHTVYCTDAECGAAAPLPHALQDLSPCELFARIRGRTLWFMGDSQTWWVCAEAGSVSIDGCCAPRQGHANSAPALPA